MAATNSSNVIGMLLLFSIVLLGLVASSIATFTDEEKEEIVRAHNNIRAKVDPVATNMEEIVSEDKVAVDIKIIVYDDIHK